MPQKSLHKSPIFKETVYFIITIGLLITHAGKLSHTSITLTVKIFPGSKQVCGLKSLVGK